MYISVCVKCVIYISETNASAKFSNENDSNNDMHNGISILFLILMVQGT